MATMQDLKVKIFFNITLWQAIKLRIAGNKYYANLIRLEKICDEAIEDLKGIKK